MMTAQLPSLNEGMPKVIQTSNHRFLVNEAGVLMYMASEDEDREQLSRTDAQELQFAEVLALVDHIQEHYAAFVQAQASLEQTWRTVADELLDAFDAQQPGSSTDMTAERVQRLLFELGPVDIVGTQSATSVAGRWYQSLWLPGETATFTQQWVPFLNVFRQRRLKRFPDLNNPVPLEEEKESTETFSPDGREVL